MRMINLRNIIPMVENYFFVRRIIACGLSNILFFKGAGGGKYRGGSSLDAKVAV